MENHFKAIHCLYRMHEEIQAGRTGTPDEFARTLRISRRQLYKMINIIKDYGGFVKYNRVLRTFYYAEEFDINLAQLLLLDLPQAPLLEPNYVRAHEYLD